MKEKLNLDVAFEREKRTDFHDADTYALKEEKPTEIEAFVRPPTPDKKIDFAKIIKALKATRRDEYYLKEKIIPELKKMQYFETKKISMNAWLQLA